MLAYKAFHPGLICLGHRFKMGLNRTAEANCGANGFHCAENPLDCLTYYPYMNQAVYCLVDAGGDRDEDAHDSKISCTELTILAKLSKEEFFLHALAYMADHPQRKWNRHVSKDWATAENGFAIVRGKDPLARGRQGDVLAFAKESAEDGRILQVALATVDGEKLKPGVWYDANFEERRSRYEKERVAGDAAGHGAA